MSLPVLFRYIEAVRKNNETVQVNWGIEHELEISRYDIESSSDGLTFKVAESENPASNNAGGGAYLSFDNKAEKSTFYRVNAVNTNGGKVTSPIVIVKNADKLHSISIFPNPVESKKMNINFTGAESGNYAIIVYDFLKKVHEMSFEIAELNLIKTVELPKTLSGNYNIVILHNNKIISSQSVVVK